MRNASQRGPCSREKAEFPDKRRERLVLRQRQHLARTAAYGLTTAATRAAPSRRSPEDFDGEGRCSRCLGKGVKCERETPVRKPGGNPHRARTVSASPYPSPSRPNLAAQVPSTSHSPGIPMPSTSTATPAYLMNGTTDAAIGQLDLLSDAAVLGDQASVSAPMDAVAMQPWQQVIGFHDSDPSAILGLPPPSAATAPFDWSFLSSLPENVSSPATTQSPVDRLLAQEASLNLDPNLPEGLSADMTDIYNMLNSAFLMSMPPDDRKRATMRSLSRQSSVKRLRLRRSCCTSPSRRRIQTPTSGSSSLRGATSQIAAVIDLWAHQMLAVSPQAGNAVLAIGDLFVMQARGVNPPLDLDTLVDHDKAALRLFAYLDILRCVTQPARTMVFDYVGLPGFGGATGADRPVESGPASFSTWFGLPGPLVSCLAACVRLVQTRSHMTPERAEAIAAAIESTIREWRLPRVDPRSFPDSMTMVAHTATLEMWRHATLIYFFSTIRNIGCLSPNVRQSLDQIVQLGSQQKAPQSPSNMDADTPHWIRQFPWFVAATVAVKPDDREACREGLKVFWCDKASEENTRAAERLWEVMDKTGRETPDWRQYLAQEGFIIHTNALRTMLSFSDRPPVLLKWRSSTTLILLAVFIGVLVDTAAFSIAAPIIPFRLEQLGYESVGDKVGWIIACFGAGLIAATPIAVYVGSKVSNRQLLLLAGLLSMAGALILFMESSSFIAMLIARLWQGMSGTILWTFGLALVIDSVPEHRVGASLGTVMAGFSAGEAMGPPIGGVLYRHLGFRAPTVFLLILLGFDLVLRLAIIEKKTALRWIEKGVVIPGFSAPTYPPAHDEVQGPKDVSPAATNPEGAAEKGQLADSSASASTGSNLWRTTWRLVQDPRASVAIGIAMLYGVVFGLLDTGMVLYVKDQYGLDEQGAGLIFIAVVVPSFIVSPLAGWLTDRYGSKWPATLGVTTFVATYPLLLIEGPLPLFVFFLVLVGVGLSCVVTPTTHDLNVAAAATPGAEPAQVFALFNLAFSVGSFIGPICGGQIMHSMSTRNGFVTVTSIGTALVALAAPLVLVYTGGRLRCGVLRPTPRTGIPASPPPHQSTNCRLLDISADPACTAEGFTMVENARPPLFLRARASTTLILLAVFLAVLVDTAAYSIAAPIIPFRLERLGYRNVGSKVGWIIACFGAGLIVATPIAVYIASKTSNRQIPLLGGAVSMAGSIVLFMECKGFAPMLVARLWQGLSGTILWTFGLALVIDSVPEQHVGKSLGIVMSGLSVGEAIGPPIGGALYRHLGWRAPFIFLLVLLVVDIVLRLLIIEKKTALMWIKRGVTIRGFSAPDYPPPNSPSIEEVVVPLAHSSTVTSSEATEVATPVLPKSEHDGANLWETMWRLVHNPRAAVALSMAFLYGADFGLLEAGMVLYVKEHYGLDEQGAGLIFLAVVIPSFIIAPLAGWLTDLYGSKWPATVGMAIVTAAFPLLIIRGPLPLFIFFLALIGVGLSAVSTPTTHDLNVAATATPGATSAQVFAAFNLAFSLGSFVGPIIGGELMSGLSTRDGFVAIVVIGAGLVALCTPFVLLFTGGRLGEKRRETKEKELVGVEEIPLRAVQEKKADD
ncbi:putative MFS-type transporter C18.02 [Rhodotorula toruloides]|nr:putative MFS-type transporter C18.02 [Rhodotorula toruloides]